MAQKKDPSLLVHLNLDECKAFDVLQGGQAVIPVDDMFSRRMEAMGFPLAKGQIRDYRPLASVIKQPEVQKLFQLVMENMGPEGEQSPELEEAYHVGKQASEHYKDIPENDPELKELANEGEGGDTEIVYMPRSVCDFMDHVRGTPPQTNSQTGFPEYGFFGKLFGGGGGGLFKSLARIATTVGGFMVGGPLGAVAGNALGRVATGQKPGGALMASLPNALYGMGAQGLGHAVGSYLPGTMAGNLGSNIAGYGGSMSTPSMMGSLFGGAAGGAQGAAGAAGAAGEAGKAAATGGGGLFGNLFGGGGGGVLSSLGTIAPLGLMAFGASRMHRGRQEELKAWEEENKRQRAEREALRERYGMNDNRDLPPLQEGSDVVPHIGERDRYEHHRFKKGGSTRQRADHLSDFVDVREDFKGDGKGQADNLKKTLPAKAYVVNATAVAHLGDGNSDAGLKVLKKFENRLRSKYKGKRIKKKVGIVKAAVSSKEYPFTPLAVTVLGKGNNSHGANQLDSAISRLMSEKSQNGSKLPPKAKPFEAYFG